MRIVTARAGTARWCAPPARLSGTAAVPGGWMMRRARSVPGGWMMRRARSVPGGWMMRRARSGARRVAGWYPEHPARQDYRWVGEDDAAHVTTEIDAGDLLIPVAVPQVMLGYGPQAVPGMDSHQLELAHRHHLGARPRVVGGLVAGRNRGRRQWCGRLGQWSS